LKKKRKIKQQLMYHSPRGVQYTREQMLERRALFFEPVQSQEELAMFLKVFFGICLPNHPLDECSTSTPLQLVWDVYHTMLTNEGAKSHVVAASRNSAKCLATGTLVATPKGPVEIQNLKLGDTVYNEHGKEIKVLMLHNQGEQECVHINTRGGSIVCTPNHRWLTFCRRSLREGISTTAQILTSRRVIKRVEITSPMGDKHEPHAYALGALLGDGCSTECGVRISSKNDKIPNKVALILGSPRALKLSSNNYSYIIKSPLKHGVKWHFSDFYEKHIRNKHSYEKTVDLDEIKTWNRQSLVAFMAGLIDTDGSVFMSSATGKQVHISFGCQSKATVESVAYLVEALWQIKPTIHVATRGYVHGPVYYCSINSIYHCKRILLELDEHIVTDSKKYKPEYDELRPNNFNPSCGGVGKVTHVGMTQCWDITVDSPTSLYCLQNGLVTHNTLCSSIMHFLAMIHFRRKCVHLASQKDQARVCMQYMDSFCRLPEVEEFFTVVNTEARSLDGLPPNWFTSKPDTMVEIATATMRGANAKRGNFITEDEVDLTDRKILAEVAGMLDPTQDEHQFDPIVVALSSRKTNSGPLQDRIDEAEADKAAGKKERIKLHKFSVIDWMKKCDKHGEPTGTLYVNQDTLHLAWDDDGYATLLDTEKPKYKPYQYYKSCRTCDVLIPCLGRCAKQVETTKRLRSHDFVFGLMREVKDIGILIAQYLNWKPETTGNVFRTFNYNMHVGTAAAAWALAFGTKPPEGLTITALARELRIQQWFIMWGIDWGFSDAAACVVAAYNKLSQKLIILKVLTLKEHSPQQFADRCVIDFGKDYFPYLVCPDTEDPASHTYFQKYRIKTRRSKPKRIVTGVSQIRGLLWNPHTQSSTFMIVAEPYDPHYDHAMECARQMSQWRHKVTPMGTFDLSSFEDGQDHTVDPIRYILDRFLVDKSKVSVSDTPVVSAPTSPTVHPLMLQSIQETYRQHGVSPDVMSALSVDSLLTEAQKLTDPLDSQTKSCKVRFSF
jgi:hypothetical protein